MYTARATRQGLAIASQRTNGAKDTPPRLAKESLNSQKKMKCTSSWAPVHPENKASIRVMEKCGFQKDSEKGETLLLPNIGGEVKLVGLCRSLSMSAPPPNLIWEG
jgi:hypothetical protein